LSTDPTNGTANQDGAEPVYGPAYGAVSTGHTQAGTTTSQSPRKAFVDGPSPPYTAPYPPYPSDVPTPGDISAPVASGLAYLVIPAIYFLISEPYRSDPLIRFHSWQAIFYFLAVAAIRVVELLLVSMLPVNIAYSTTGLLLIVLSAGWLIAVIKAFQGNKWMLPVIGSYAAQTASTVSSK
jgi:uncharacterized membrane protein